MSELTEFVAFCQHMGAAGLRSITVSGELAARLSFEASKLDLTVEPRLSGSMTIAGVDIVVDHAEDRMRRDIRRQQEEMYLAVKANALADGMVEREPGHFVRPGA